MIRYKKFLESRLSDSQFKELEEVCSEILSNANTIKDIMINWSDESSDMNPSLESWVKLQSRLRNHGNTPHLASENATGFSLKEENGELVMDREKNVEYNTSISKAMIQFLGKKYMIFEINLGYLPSYMISSKENMIIDKMEEEIKSRIPLSIVKTKRRSRNRNNFDILEVSIPF
jgi:hypothetical protein